MGTKLHSLYASTPFDDRLKIPHYSDLEVLALDMRWSWSHANDVWQQLDPELWHLTHNPWVVLQSVSAESLRDKFKDPSFCSLVASLMEKKKEYEIAETWFHKHYSESELSHVAYFSMEYMLGESLPIYSGGLGNVAGDQLKAASDLGVPVVAVGLLYQQGYFRQMIEKDGTQQALYPYNDPGQLPITPLRKQNGEWIRLEIPFPGWSIWIRAWQVRVGKVRLLLLDSNDAANFPAHRPVTSELYGGGSDLRLKQELLLGVLGWRLLEELEINPEVCHLNEGHPAFAVIERARQFMKKTGVPFLEALNITRAGNVFTTHTAVPAGFDRFSPSQMQQYLSGYVSLLGISMHQFMSLGRVNASDDNESFNMAYLAIRGSSAVNAVSELHEEVSQRLFAPLFPMWPKSEIPVGHVTNGVHIPSWISPQAAAIWDEAQKQKKSGLFTLECEDKSIEAISDQELWAMRNAERKQIVDFVRLRHSKQLSARGCCQSEVDEAKRIFDEHTLTLGFARRFATYKRPNMLLQDPERLLKILTHPSRPVQLIIAGKAHPADVPGQALIKQWMEFINQNKETRAHVVFLADYDMLMTGKMVGGVDVWINTPRRPWEACGTSGMKVLSNGGLNVSELDGWWAEAYTPEVGWAIGDGQERGEDPAWDIAEAGELYRILEEEIVPLFYERDPEGVPIAWIKKMKKSMMELTPRFSASRSVSEYTEKYYLPAAKRYTERTLHFKEKGTSITQWKEMINLHWSKLRFSEVTSVPQGDNFLFNIQVYLDGLDPKMVKVEIYADANEKEGQKVVCREMTLVRSLSGTPNCYLYEAKVPSDRPETSYTARMVPYFEGLSIPLEENKIIWQR